MSGILQSLTDQIDLAWKAFIRPTRNIYDPARLGPKSFRFKNVPIARHDFQVQNFHGHTIECSLFAPRKVKNPRCIVYLHGNCGCKVEGVKLVKNFCVQEYAVLCFDFAGCGRSGGEYISLGWFESLDI